MCPTLAFLGSALADFVMHVGQSSPATAVYYLKLANVIKAGASTDLLGRDSPAVTEAADLFFFKDFIILSLVSHLLLRSAFYRYFFLVRGVGLGLGRTRFGRLYFAGF